MRLFQAQTMMFVFVVATSVHLAAAQDLFLAPKPHETTSDVIVIGAGWAGMTAGHTLHQQNVSFTILEATNRTGGRSHAISFGHSSVGEFIVERGSNWVCGLGGGAAGAHPSAPSQPTINPVHTLVDLVGLKTTRVPGSSLNMSNYAAVFDSDGEPADLDWGVRHRANAAYECVNVTNRTQDTNMRAALKDCGWEPQTEVEWTVDWALTVDENGLPANLQDLPGVLPDPTYQWWGKDDLFVIDQHPRGYARLLDELVKDTVPTDDPRIVYNAFVNKIEYDCDGVRVTTRDGRSFKAKLVISTLPLGVLQRNHQNLFSPPMPTKHARLLMDSGLVMANLTHIVLQFAQVWWNNTLPRWLSANKGAQAVSGDFVEWQNLNHDSMIPRSQVLLTFVGDPQSSIYEGLTDDEVQAAVMSHLRSQHPKRNIPDPVAFFLSRHGYDELSYGAYSTVSPGWKDKYQATLTKPLSACNTPRVRFAGEALCSNFGGYTHGGYQSGLEAAAAYLHHIGKGPKPSSVDSLNLCWGF